MEFALQARPESGPDLPEATAGDIEQTEESPPQSGNLLTDIAESGVEMEVITDAESGNTLISATHADGEVRVGDIADCKFFAGSEVTNDQAIAVAKMMERGRKREAANAEKAAKEKQVKDKLATETVKDVEAREVKQKVKSIDAAKAAVESSYSMRRGGRGSGRSRKKVTAEVDVFDDKLRAELETHFLGLDEPTDGTPQKQPSVFSWLADKEAPPAQVKREFAITVDAEPQPDRFASIETLLDPRIALLNLQATQTVETGEETAVETEPIFAVTAQAEVASSTETNESAEDAEPAKAAALPATRRVSPPTAAPTAETLALPDVIAPPPPPEANTQTDAAPVAEAYISDLADQETLPLAEGIEATVLYQRLPDPTDPIDAEAELGVIDMALPIENLAIETEPETELPPVPALATAMPIEVSRAVGTHLLEDDPEQVIVLQSLQASLEVAADDFVEALQIETGDAEKVAEVEATLIEQYDELLQAIGYDDPAERQQLVDELLQEIRQQVEDYELEMLKTEQTEQPLALVERLPDPTDPIDAEAELGVIDMALPSENVAFETEPEAELPPIPALATAMPIEVNLAVETHLLEDDPEQVIVLQSLQASLEVAADDFVGVLQIETGDTEKVAEVEATLIEQYDELLQAIGYDDPAERQQLVDELLQEIRQQVEDYELEMLKTEQTEQPLALGDDERTNEHRYGSLSKAASSVSLGLVQLRTKISSLLGQLSVAQTV